MVERLRLQGVAELAVKNHVFAHCRAPPVGGFEQALHDDDAQATQQTGCHGGLLLWRIDLNGAVDGLGARFRVHGSVGQVAGQTGFDGRINRFQVAHLADADDGRFAAHGVAQAGRKALDVPTNLRLVGLRAFPVRAAQDKLNRVFVGNDLAVWHVDACIAIDGRLQRGLAGTSRAADQHQAHARIERLEQVLFDAHLGDVRQFIRNQPHRDGIGLLNARHAPLNEVAAKAQVLPALDAQVFTGQFQRPVGTVAAAHVVFYLGLPDGAQQHGQMPLLDGVGRSLALPPMNLHPRIIAALYQDVGNIVVSTVFQELLERLRAHVPLEIVRLELNL